MAHASELKEEKVPDLNEEVTESDFRMASDYLQHYYGLQGESLRRRKRSDSSLISKVKDMQSFFGLNVTGSLDTETLEIMKEPRCGVPDAQDYSHNQGAKWNKNVISYSIGKYTADLPTRTVDSEIESALRVWSQASPLRFVRSASRQADIMVEFASRAHGDSYPFDGPRGTLAHAFGPGGGIGGDTHFDDSERWTAGSEGFRLHLVAAHEFGHALGLKHSRDPASLMYPTYKNRNPQNLLSNEDVTKINALYGKRGSPSSRPQWGSLFNPWLLGPRFPFLMQDKCSPSLSFDAVTSLGDTELFFKDRYMWIKYSQQCDVKEGPINNFMPKITSSIDAAYSIPRKSSAYLFKGSSFWTVRGSQVKGRPKSIYRYGLPRWVEHIDAAAHINTTGRTLLFSQDLYWSYDENRRAMEDSSPRSISDDFPGISPPVSAAAYRDGFIHFFLGSEVYKYDYSQKRVADVNKANSWLGCEQEVRL
ncbi:matrix metalloproteinase-20 [Megalops cyprinoides]|uniref:matrix metalloproteinase-20 n=1 Tax=Megalops cyprinoides TaxID=118141 RepID=UPI0018651596|nr:matrix metalloproteinase-20 [Megalops cyprinoides]